MTFSVEGTHTLEEWGLVGMAKITKN